MPLAAGMHGDIQRDKKDTGIALEGPKRAKPDRARFWGSRMLSAFKDCGKNALARIQDEVKGGAHQYISRLIERN